jgi:uncharacterized RDD family membrane protein YckC
MLELYAVKATTNSDDKHKTDEEKRRDAMVMLVAVMIWILLWVWALVRALECSSATPDSRVMHLFFATSSPLLYLVFSYTVQGFCPK